MDIPKFVTAGQVYCFPLHKLAYPYEETGFWGACKVLRVDNDGAVIAGLGWAGKSPISLEQISGIGILDLVETEPDKSHAIFWREKNKPPENFTFVGSIEPTGIELDLIKCNCKTRHCSCIKMLGGWKALKAALNREWRKRLDAEAYEVERAWIIAQMKSNKSVNDERQISETDNTSLISMSKEEIFDNWETHLPPDLLLACREIIYSTLDQLLGKEKPTNKDEILKIFQNCVQELNRLNQEHGFIDTAKREDICFEINRMAKAAGIKEQNIADKWREW